MRIAGLLLLLLITSIALHQAPPAASAAGSAQKICSCEGRCGECPARLRGCFNGIPFCECFRC